MIFFFFFSSRRRHTRSLRDWSSDVCSSDLTLRGIVGRELRVADDAGDGRDVHDGAAPARLQHLEEREARDEEHTGERSEERRVGKECRSRGSPKHEKKKKIRKSEMA